MARQVLPLVDFRTSAQKQGITANQQTLQSIANILKTVGLAEQKRRERQQLDRVATAIAGGATNLEAINLVASQAPEFSEGLQGVLQKVGGIFSPETGGGIGQDIQQTIIQDALRKALTPSKTPSISEQRAAEAKRVGAVPGTPGFEAIAEGPKTLKPTKRKPFTLKQTADMRGAIQKRIDGIEKRDIPGIGSGQRKNVHFQEDIIQAYKNALLGFEFNETQQKQFDRIWDAKAKKLTPVRQQEDSKGNIVKVGWDPNSPEVKQARREIKTKEPEPQISQQQLESAPDERLDQFWADLPDEEKLEIIQKLKENPDNINSILRILQGG